MGNPNSPRGPGDCADPMQASSSSVKSNNHRNTMDDYLQTQVESLSGTTHSDNIQQLAEMTKNMVKIDNSSSSSSSSNTQ